MINRVRLLFGSKFNFIALDSRGKRFS